MDDYGNVRVDSSESRKALDEAGYPALKRFDRYDALETREDLEALFEVLDTVKDQHGKPAVFTPYALTRNIDFEKMASEDDGQYYSELVSHTFERKAEQDPIPYQGTWKLWQKGMEEGYLSPEFHGREHFNLRVFLQKLKEKDAQLMASLKHRSNIALQTKGDGNFKYSAAFGFKNKEDLAGMPEIIKEGMLDFREVYGRQATVFTPSASQFPPSLVKHLPEYGIEALDKPFFTKRYQESGKYAREFNFLGYDKKNGLTILVRNVIFEPIDDNTDRWINLALRQIEAAFRWGKPANISSHRVNFCGHIDKKNREKGLDALKVLLGKIVERWPDAEFISARDLAKIIGKSEKVERL